MIKYETINGTLCRMVEPTPLQLDSPMPCVVRYIQDCSPMGRYLKRKYGMVINTVAIVSRIGTDGRAYSSDKIFVEEVEVLEIIGYPVVEGSIEWAWYQRCMLDIPVIGPNGVTPNNNFTLKQWCGQYSLTSMKTGWRLYEPEPEPEPAKEQFEVGDWVTNGVVVGHIAVINDGLAWVKAKDAQYHISVGHLRKLDPSEVVIHIGCLSGTVEKASDFDMFLLWHSKKDCDYSMIRFDALDPATRSLVESLLNAQEEK